MNDFKCEFELVEHIVKYDIPNRFNNILKTEREYMVQGKSVDIYILTKFESILIEVKMDLNPYDIGQILTYQTLFNMTNYVDSTIFLYVLNVNNSLDTILECLKINNINLNIVDYTNNVVFNKYTNFNGIIPNYNVKYKEIKFNEIKRSKNKYIDGFIFSSDKKENDIYKFYLENNNNGLIPNKSLTSKLFKVSISTITRMNSKLKEKDLLYTVGKSLILKVKEDIINE